MVIDQQQYCALLLTNSAGMYLATKDFQWNSNGGTVVGFPFEGSVFRIE